MTKALTIINRAAELLGYKDPRRALNGTDAANFLDVLNTMVDAWNTSRLNMVAVQEVAQSVSGQTITIGPGGAISMTRPTRMEDGAFIRANGADFAIRWIERAQFDEIVVKATPGTIAYVGYYEPALPLGVIHLWPYPSTPVELHLQCAVQLTEFADLNTDYTLAPGYQRAMELSLAEELSPGRKAVPPEVVAAARNARRAIRRQNVEVPRMNADPMGGCDHLMGGWL